MDYRLHGTRWFTSSVFLLHNVKLRDAAGPVNRIPGTFESTVTAGAYDKVVYIPGNTLSIQVTSIEDSRCPAEFLCIWGRVAEVTFSITELEQDIVLYAGVGSNPQFLSSSSFNFLGQSYDLTLADVTPYPSNYNREDRQKAHFSVRRLGK